VNRGPTGAAKSRSAMQTGRQAKNLESAAEKKGFWQGRRPEGLYGKSRGVSNWCERKEKKNEKTFKKRGLVTKKRRQRTVNLDKTQKGTVHFFVKGGNSRL